MDRNWMNQRGGEEAKKKKQECPDVKHSVEKKISGKARKGMKEKLKRIQQRRRMRVPTTTARKRMIRKEGMAETLDVARPTLDQASSEDGVVREFRPRTGRRRRHTAQGSAGRPGLGKRRPPQNQWARVAVARQCAGKTVLGRKQTVHACVRVVLTSLAIRVCVRCAPLADNGTVGLMDRDVKII